MESKCIVCGSPDTHTIFVSSGPSCSGTVQFSPTADDFGISSCLYGCKNCGIRFCLPAPDHDSIRRLYADSKDPLYVLQATQRCVTYRRVLSLLRRRLPPKASLLDAGCSYGLLLSLARRQGLSVAGVELSRDAARYCTEASGLKVFCGDIRDADFPEGSFDAVTALEVIEHMPDPQAALEKLKGLLKPAGILCLATPDTGSLSAKALGLRWWSYRKVPTAYFSRKSMAAFLSRNGFSILEARTYRKTFLLSYILARAGRRSYAKGFGCLDIPLTLSFGDMLVLAQKGSRER
ncbi:MAG: class I SAM-dependent methyltransferase [Candidatus Omnitrophica bacterium]|nr:class I SAM-dependent methyltransferase [Candidatus Omnitrophota bacterium]